MAQAPKAAETARRTAQMKTDALAKKLENAKLDRRTDIERVMEVIERECERSDVPYSSLVI